MFNSRARGCHEHDIRHLPAGSALLIRDMSAFLASRPPSLDAPPPFYAADSTRPSFHESFLSTSHLQEYSEYGSIAAHTQRHPHTLATTDVIAQNTEHDPGHEGRPPRASAGSVGVYTARAEGCRRGEERGDRDGVVPDRHSSAAIVQSLVQETTYGRK